MEILSQRIYAFTFLIGIIKIALYMVLYFMLPQTGNIFKRLHIQNMEHVMSQDKYMNADLKVHFKEKLHNNSLRTSRKRGSIWGLGKGRHVYSAWGHLW